MAQKLKSAELMERIESESPTYKLDCCLGEGLSSRVYRALRLDSRGHSKQVVCLKILKNKNQVSWLRQEFEALSKIDSIYCVRMLAWENLKLGPALVLEYIEGITLFELLRFEDLIEEQILEIIAQVQLGLQALDRSGYFHGDLNLKNIMIDKAGNIKLIDFSMSTANQINAQELFGTPQYLSPEVWRGQGRSLQADLFALGLIEIDLKEGILKIPEGIENCKRRAESAQNTDTFFLSSDPSQRSFKKIQRNSFIQRQLGKLVASILERRSLSSQQTLQLPFRQPVKKSAQLALLVVLVTSCFVVPVTSTPLVRLDSNLIKPRLGHLEIRTKKWYRVFFDGNDLGYSPVILENLRAGIHKLKWQDISKSGELKFKTEPGELRIINDRDFETSIKVALRPESELDSKH